jgi:Flp pilus assembly protein TadG
MRRLTGHRDDSGAVTIFVVIAMPVLILFAALTFDGARGYVARREAQNSADAAALAMATDCAKASSPVQVAACVSGADTTAGNYKRSLAQRSSITPENVVSADTYCDTTAGMCKATMQQPIGFHFAPGGRSVIRSATARWGAIGSAITAPVVISQCTFDLATVNGTTFPSAETIIPLGSGGPECPGRPPGAFGWLDTGLDGPCSIKTTTVNTSGQHIVHGNTGNGNVNPWDCITQVGVNGKIMIPIYGAACNSPSPCIVNQNDGNGNNNYYLILGYAELEVTGWNLQHGSPKKAGTPVPSGPMCSGSNSCIRGRFVRFATQQGSSGPGADFGIKRVYLSS